MIMREWPVAEASGAILAHSIPPFKKGRVLTDADVAVLRASGTASVLAARLEPGDVHEDEAAGRLATAAAGTHTTPSAAFTGRCNIYAAASGLAIADMQAVARINAIDEAITLATLAPFEPVRERTMLATVKIIPFAIAEAALQRAVEEAAPSLIRVAPFRPKDVGLISTRIKGMKESLLNKNRSVLEERMGRLGSRVVSETRADHAMGPLAQALSDAAARGTQIICIVGASAIVDRGDVIPQAILAAGGEIIRFGMPVDPGNLLLLGRLGPAPVIGLPGCARSPKRNGFDFVLERLCADLPVTANDIAAMGAGGLLKEIPSRPAPREGLNPALPQAPRIAALILAAGLSRRMGGANKLLAPIQGKPLLEWTLRACRKSQASSVLLVSGHDREAVESIAMAQDCPYTYNPAFASGMASSLRTGLAQLPPDADGVLIALGDMPAIRPEDIDRLIAAFNPAEGRTLIVPTYQGERGHPVLFARSFWPAMAEAQGDMGAKAVLAENAHAITEVETGHPGVLADADTPDALSRLQELMRHV